MDNLKRLLRKDELDFEKRNFKGKLAGTAYKYSQSLDGLARRQGL